MKFSKEILKGAIDPVVLQVLQTHGESYGYELVQRIKEKTDGIFDLREGTVYPLLYRLEDQKYISSTRKMTPSGKERRYYAITKSGSKLLEKKTVEYAAFLRAMQRALHLSLG